MDYPFKYYTDRSDFQNDYHELFYSLLGKRVLRVFGVWDLPDNSWFEETPIIIEFENGMLSVVTKSFHSISVLWNVLFPSEKPTWLGEAPELDWSEDLIWKEYISFDDTVIEKAEILHSSTSIIGLVFSTNQGMYGIVDNGDINVCMSEESLIKYLFDVREDFSLSNVQYYMPEGEQIELGQIV